MSEGPPRADTGRRVAGSEPLLTVTGLRVTFAGEVDALRDVSFTLDAGQSLAIVGESGSGKSTLALCLLGLIQPPVATGSVLLAGTEMLGQTEAVMRSLRWSVAALALQGSPFNPVVTVGAQIVEPLRDRNRSSRSDAHRRAAVLAEEVALDPLLLDRYPHQLSGGERRRASLAMVLALDPALVILDEPTAGLDPSTRADLVERIVALSARRGFATIVISHDLPDAAALAERTIVLYAGKAIEDGDTASVMLDPVHPYSSALINAFPVMSTTKDLRP
ncbi:MAG: ABC transporter ATP-binding protein, partial [Ilumatobacteraceae bacterium]